MICAIVICALAINGGAKQCDPKQPPARVVYIEAPKVIGTNKECAETLHSAQKMRRPGEWPMRGDFIGRKPKGEEE